MAGDSAKFDGAEVSAKVTSIKTTMETLNTKFNDIKTKIATFDSVWSGDEADRFKKKLETFTGNMESFNKEINEYILFLEGVAGVYSNIETELIAAISTSDKKE